MYPLITKDQTDIDIIMNSYIANGFTKINCIVASYPDCPLERTIKARLDFSKTKGVMKFLPKSICDELDRLLDQRKPDMTDCLSKATKLDEFVECDLGYHIKCNPRIIPEAFMHQTKLNLQTVAPDKYMSWIVDDLKGECTDFVSNGGFWSTFGSTIIKKSMKEDLPSKYCFIVTETNCATIRGDHSESGLECLVPPRKCWKLSGKRRSSTHKVFEYTMVETKCNNIPVLF